MWVDLDCPSCGGSGDEPGAEGFTLDGVYYSGRFPCGDCNGNGKQSVWFDTCKACGGLGKSLDGKDCPRCRGVGIHEPEPSSKVSRWEIIEG
jgi:DnaJ-class molecular chaperone